MDCALASGAAGAGRLPGPGHHRPGLLGDAGACVAPQFTAVGEGLSSEGMAVASRPPGSPIASSVWTRRRRCPGGAERDGTELGCWRHCQAPMLGKCAAGQEV